MASSDSLPIAIYGRDAKIAETLRSLLLPDIDIVHTCLSLHTASTELPPLCAGDLSTTPSSGLGTNADLPVPSRRLPRALFFGGGVPDDEVASVSELVQARSSTGDFAIMRVTREDVHAEGASGPDPEAIARVYRKKLRVAGLL